MVFSQDTWWIMGLLVAAAISIISFFLKRNINQTDNHERDINEIKRTYVTKNEIRYFAYTILRDEFDDYE